MRNYSVYFIVGVILIFVTTIHSGCGQQQSENVSKQQVRVNDTLGLGFYYLTNTCATCHAPDPEMQAKVAPDLEEIKRYYVPVHATLAEVTTGLQNFLSKPDSSETRIPGAVEQYGRMSKMLVSDEAILAMATYLMQPDIGSKNWYAEVYPEEKKQYAHIASSLGYMERGLQLAMQTKAVLGKNLLQAIQTQGADGAVSFCSTKALPITDSMATVLNTNIKRVSDRNRNPLNAANKEELAFIQSCRTQQLEGKPLKPQVSEMDNKVIAYYPILTDKMCLQCHGSPITQILPATLTSISKAYPGDKATGFSEGELRGIWVVEMSK